MISISFAEWTATVRRPAVVTDHGQQVPNYGAAAASVHTVPSCIVQPAGASEDVTDRAQVTDVLQVQTSPDADLQRWDSVTFAGTTPYPGQYRVDGDPQVWYSPTGGLSHLAFTATKVKDISHGN